MAAALWPQGRAVCYLQKSNGSVAGNGQRWPFYGAPKHSLEVLINTSCSAKLTFSVKVTIFSNMRSAHLKELNFNVLVFF